VATAPRPAADKNVLLICGSPNQTAMMLEVGRHLTDYACAYSPYYCDGLLERLRRAGFLERTILGGRFRELSDRMLAGAGVEVDPRGETGDYDLVVTCSDLIVQKNIRGRRIVLIQEGMTDPENFLYRAVRRLGLPLWLASTSTTGQSGAYLRFCVASDGYREFFAQKGIDPARMVVTGLPNFDDCRSFVANDFPHRDYVLVATSDTRETFKWDNRRSFLRRVAQIADGRPLLFKLHPNENHLRSSREIARTFPGALVLAKGNTNHMVANCDVLITQYSTVVYVGLALGKECHSYFSLELLRSLLPEQNGGRSAARIAAVCRESLDGGGA
jgi:hypothetical protein